ncbi:hypothetical protein BJA5080_04872 [Bradyrhizobium diazoefficiens SEMIA 5080]|uniref:Uncharacterized protein n=2 Tax=Bradyrhizobium diazoefficiens TaxID=1355477 RepID=A0A837CJ64_9BRAD|nr:hypothetical protein BJA5080_04872 [Bradyrhizobium diazoefficiens SEMIA 5080]
MTYRKSASAAAAKVRRHDSRTSIALPRRQVGSGSCRPGDATMSLILRILFVLAGAITALFVARDALNFTIIQTFVAILLVTAVLLAGSLWSLRRKT